MRPPVRLFGMPLHPALVHFPLALLLASLAWDLVGLALDDDFWRRLAFWTLVGGLVTAVPTAIAGILEFLDIPKYHPGLRMARLHWVVNAVALAAFAVSFILRLSDPTPVRYGIAVGMGGLGGVLIVGGATLGGLLVFRYGFGQAEMEHAGHTPVLRRSPPGRREATRPAF